jgi:lipopolysaccharide biosynthesis regulator YciM
VIGDQAGEIRSLSWMAMLKAERGDDLSEVYRMLNEALHMADTIKLPFGIAQVECTFGGIALKLKQYDDAKTHLRRALDVGINAKVNTVIFFTVAGFAKIMEANGDKIRAFELATFVQNSPRNYVTFMTDELVQSIINHVSGELSQEVLEAARARSQTLTLEAITAELLVK